MHVLFSISERENCCPARQPSAFWTLRCIRDTLPFRIRLKSYFSAGGKWNEWEKKKVWVCVWWCGFRLPPLDAVFKVRQSEKKNCTHMSRRVWIGRKWSASRGSAAKGRNFHLCEKLFKNICWRPDAETGCARLAVPNTGSCKVKDRHLSRGRWSVR